MLVPSSRDLQRVLDLLSGRMREDKLLEAFRIDESIVMQIDPLKFLRTLYSLPTEVKSIMSYWCRCGTLVGVHVEGLLTPSGSVLLYLSTFKRSKSIIDLPSVLDHLKRAGMCIMKRDLAYIPGLFYFSDHVMLTTQDELFERQVDEVISLSGEVESSLLHVPLPDTVLVGEKTSLQEAYADAILRLRRYFFAEVVSFVYNLVSIPSIVPLVFEVPIDLVVTTKYDLIAHKFVNVDKTVKRGFSSITKYIEYGFDKVVLIHYSEKKPSTTLYKTTLVTLLTRPLLQWAGYVVVRGYEIDELLVLKVPTYNRSTELYGSRGQAMKSLIRGYLKTHR